MTRDHVASVVSYTEHLKSRFGVKAVSLNGGGGVLQMQKASAFQKHWRSTLQNLGSPAAKAENKKDSFLGNCPWSWGQLWAKAAGPYILPYTPLPSVPMGSPT